MQPTATEFALPTADSEWRKHTVARLNTSNFVAYLSDNPHRLVAHLGTDFSVSLAVIEP
jgi:hypothetical protein